jgi:transposase
MYLRPCYREKDGKRHAYWALVESYRTERGPRQRVVAYLGEADERGRLGVKGAAEGRGHRQGRMFEEDGPEWVEVDAKRVRLEREREFGGAWLGRELWRQLGLGEFTGRIMDGGRAEVPWSVMAQLLVIFRLCEPSSELRLAEHLYARSALGEMLGVSGEQLNDDRLYRALDRLLPHKAELETHLKNRLGEMFGLEYDLFLYDMTSTYFEGESAGNAKAQRGYSRDHRPDCKQVTIALVVTRCGMPLGYEVFAGNRSDSTTVEEVVTTMESRYGKADRVWVMDRGMVSEANVEFLKKGGRKYILGTPKGQLRRHERELVEAGWDQVRPGVEVKLCPAPGGDEVFILCRSAPRREKERAMHERFEKRIEDGLKELEASCLKRRQDPVAVAQRLGRLMGRNTRAAGLFLVDIGGTAKQGARLSWSKKPEWRAWAALSEGCYMLRSNVTDWDSTDLWEAYIQMTDAESAFRVDKSDLGIRPIWHRKEQRVDAHILVCFLAYVLWKTLGQLCRHAGLGNEPRRVLDELMRIRAVDVVLPTKQGTEIRRRCIVRPSPHQSILLDRLGLQLPRNLKMTDL